MANVGHLHDLGHRLSRPWFHNKLGYIDQSFRGEFAYEAELILSDSDTSDSAHKRGVKFLQLLADQQRGGVRIFGRLTLSSSIRAFCELYSQLDKRILLQRAPIPTYSTSIMFCARERRSTLVWTGIDIDGDG